MTKQTIPVRQQQPSLSVRIKLAAQEGVVFPCAKLSDVAPNMFPLPGTASINPEQHDGNVEYKLKLQPNPRRFVRLVTQMNFRLLEGAGQATYLVGVADNGNLCGVSLALIQESIKTIEEMAQSLGARTTITTVLAHNKSVWRKSHPNCLAPGKHVKADKWVAQVDVLRLSSNHTDAVGTVAVQTKHCPELRVAICGDVGSGKSTLMSVLATGETDDGCGSARMEVLRHPHELLTGITSCVSVVQLGFDAQGTCLNHNSGVHRPTPSEVAATASKVVLLHDLAGNPRYMKTTLCGLTAHFPDLAMLVVPANCPPPITTAQTDVPPSTTCFASNPFPLVEALGLEVVVVLTKTDIATAEQLQQTIGWANASLAGLGKTARVVSQDCDPRLWNDCTVPMFTVSSVTMDGIETLHKFLATTQITRETPKSSRKLFAVDSKINVDGVGPVICGTLLEGALKCGDSMLVGPHPETQKFHRCVISSMHTHGLPVTSLVAPRKCSISLKFQDDSFLLRKGVVLVSPGSAPTATTSFTARLRVFADHPTAVLPKHSPPLVVHVGAVRQLAHLEVLATDPMREQQQNTPQPPTRSRVAPCAHCDSPSTDPHLSSLVRFTFARTAEFVREGDRVLFNQDGLCGAGVVTLLHQ